jgi:hypothetical protein
MLLSVSRSVCLSLWYNATHTHVDNNALDPSWRLLACDHSVDVDVLCCCDRSKVP